ncbi:MAG: hypothetical protein DRJ15_16510, partial [Bacteroidetes bacterium]
MAAGDTKSRHYIEIDIDGGKAARALKSIDQNLKKTRTSAQALQASFQRLNSALGILVGANVFGGIIKGGLEAVDTYNELSGRINLVAKYTVGLEQAQKDLSAASRETYTSYEATASLYSRLGSAARQLGLSHERLVGVTKTVANTLRLSGASSQEARSSMLQLSQAMASGVLSGDEFKSISENNVAMLNLLTEAMGKTRGELKKMADDQELTTKVVVQALEKMEGKYYLLAKALGVTTARAFQVLKDETTKLIVEFE